MNIAIAGYGIEGKASAAYWHTRGDSVTILDERPIVDTPRDMQVVTGAHAFDALDEYDRVIRTASLRPDKLASAKKIWSATNEFFAQCPAPIIGVTGTKGKGTTCSLITSILRAAGYTVHLVGNIGVPALEILPNIQPSDIVVYELSSFQLWDLKQSPHIAVVLMIEPDHLDVHADFAEYIAAKSHVSEYQTEDDIVIYHPTNEISKQVANAGNGRKVRYRIADDGQVYVQSNTFCVQDKQICSTNTVQLRGAHNLDNTCAAISAVYAYDPSISNGDIEAGLRAFTGLPHRLKFVRKVKDVCYYDDSIATTPGSAIAALKSFIEPKTIILGGSDKGADYHEIVTLCRETNSQIIAIGQTGERIYSLALQLGVQAHRVTGKMAEAVQLAHSIAASGSVVILSPASASFDQYKSYSARGDSFIHAVENLA